MNKTKPAVLVISEATGKRIRRVCLEEPAGKKPKALASWSLMFKWSALVDDFRLFCGYTFTYGDEAIYDRLEGVSN